jgi:UDPglucose 6-dehydrogenase
MKIAMIGSGYVGLVSGACFADFGYRVICVDADADKISALQTGRISIYEPGLEQLVATNAEAGRLSFTTDLAEAVRGADVVFIAVGTPSRRGDGHADLRHVYSVAHEIAPEINDYKVIAIKSTVPVGTGDAVEDIIRQTKPAALFSVVSNPEFLREGAAIEDFKRPDRVVVGVPDDRSRIVMEGLYRPLSLNRAPVLFADRRSSEIIKYASNAFLATKITFINEVADLCERAGADVQQVAHGIGLDRRIGGKFLNAGPGYGGSCFPKDLSALIKTGNDFDVPLRIAETVSLVNEERKRAMGRKVIKACGGSVKNWTIAVLGLAFKPNTDDMRDAPSIAITQVLKDAGARIRAYDPKAMDNARGVIEGIEYASSVYSCLDRADAMVLVTEWDMFRALDITNIKRLLKQPIVVDLRNVYRPEEMQQAGITYFGIGRAIEHARTDRDDRG